MPSAARQRRPRSDGERSRRAILAAAGALASTEGLDGLTIGRLAEHVGMSKSGLFAHFGSKQELQLATIAAAEEVFAREVLAPAKGEPEGVRRIAALIDAFLSYLERGVFPGGCFFAVTSSELAAHDGPAAERIRELNEENLARLAGQVRAARAAGELADEVDPEQLAFELDSLMLGAHSCYLLFGDPVHLERARRAVRDRLGLD